MSSGLTRRRGGGTGGGGDGEEDHSRVASPAPKAGGGSSRDNTGPETSYEAGENGHKIAFDPRDISESAERSKQPKLTLMEEVLLLGLKDKQVRDLDKPPPMPPRPSNKYVGIPIFLERQYLLCATWMHCYRACVPWSYKHAKRLIKAEIPPS